MDIQRQHGFTLIEILITVVILSIGLLGMAGIQLSGLKSNHSASLRTQATLLANDMAERMHANPGGASDPGGTPSYANIDISKATVNCGTVPATYCSNYKGNVAADDCTPTQMVQFDIYVWACGASDHEGVTNVLPNGRATVSCTDIADDGNACTPGSNLTVTVLWDERDPDSNAGIAKPASVSLSTVP